MNAAVTEIVLMSGSTCEHSEPARSARLFSLLSIIINENRSYILYTLAQQWHRPAFGSAAVFEITADPLARPFLPMLKVSYGPVEIHGFFW